MVKVEPMWLGDYPVVSIEVRLPKTNLLIIQTDHGYVMCGALDVQLLRNKLTDRGVIAARAVGVKTRNELLGGTGGDLEHKPRKTSGYMQACRFG